MKNHYIILVVLAVFSFKCYSQQTLGLFTNSSESLDGYTLFSPQSSTESYLINNCGEKIPSWSSQYLPGLSSYLLEDGILLRTGRQSGMGGGIGIVEMLDWNSNVIWSHSVSSTHGRQHHDIELLPNGNLLLIVWDNRTDSEVTQAGSSTTNNSINSEQIVEIQPDLVNGGATIVWEWKAWDHLIQEADITKDDYGIVANHPGRIDINFLNHNSSDWLHFNGVDYNEEFDQIIISVHNFSEFWIIDHSTTLAESANSTGGTYGKGGDILYRWGNPQAYNQGNASDQKLFLQHNTHWIPENYLDAGKIILFNNQVGSQPNPYSTVNIVELPVDADGFYSYNGGAFGPENFDWTYQAPNPTDFYSNIISGVQRLENGNTLICEGIPGRYFEIDSNQNIVWEYVNPVNDLGPQAQGTSISDNNTFRCTRYSPNYPGLSGQILTPQGYIETGSTFTCDLYTIEDQVVTVIDILNLLSEFGCLVSCQYDATGDGIVNVNDLLYLLSMFGTVSSQCDSATVFANESTNAVCFETTANTRHIFTNDIPDHTYGPFGGANNIQGQDLEYSMCLFPTLNTTTTPLTQDPNSQGCGGGIVFGLSLQGILYSPFARLYWINPNTQEENMDFVIEAEFTLNMDLNGGHVNNVSRYHYHNVPIDYFTNDLGISRTDHSPLLGYAADGFPIYYKYLYTNPMNSMGGISEFQSDYQLKTGTRPGDGITAPDGVYDGTYIQDYEQIPLQSELDECGGRFGVTPDYPDGTYYYVLTDNWPYIPRCLKGNFIDNTFKIGPNCPPSASATDCATSSTMNTDDAMYGTALNISIDPTSTLLNLHIAENLVDKITGIDIYHSSGQIVFSSNAYQENIQTAHLSEGIYYVQVNMGQNQVTRKIIFP